MSSKASKPPKPFNRPSSPRFKSLKNKGNAIKTAIDAVSKLSNEEPSHEHFTLWQQETNAEKSHRGAAILLATNVENALQNAIVQMIEIKPNQRSSLFTSSNAPLHTFSNKVTMAYALNIFGEETKRNLDIIRCIRNAFAHAKLPISFETDEIQKLCDFLIIPVLLKPHVVQKLSPGMKGRALFQHVCNAIAHNLVIFSMKFRCGIDPKALNFVLPADMHLMALPLPLP